MLLPVLSDSADQKNATGCRNCPLLAHSEQHEDFCASDDYKHNVETIKKRLYDPHKITQIGIREEYTKVDVLFVGESPDKFAESQQKPFVGRMGHLLRTTIDEVFKGSDYKVGFAYVVRCRAPENRKSLNKTEVNACSVELEREIKARKPKLLVAVGAEALKVLGAVGGVVQISGTIIKTDNPRIPQMPLLACMSPGYIFQQGNDIVIEQFYKSIGNARKFLDGTLKSKGGVGQYKTLKTVKQVRKYIRRWRTAGLIAVDSESATLSPFEEGASLLCYSVSHCEGQGVTIPMYHKDSPFKGEKLREVADLMLEVMADPDIKKVFQHGKHDTKYLRKCGGGPTKIDPAKRPDKCAKWASEGKWAQGIVGDTLYKHQMVDETRGQHGLDRLAYVYTDMGGYEKELEKYIKSHPDCDPKKGGSYKNIPGKVLFDYAAKDADVTFRANAKMDRQLEKENPAALKVTKKLQPILLMTLAKMEYRGARVSRKRVRLVRRRLRKKVKTAKKELLRKKIIRRFIAEKSQSNSKFEFKPSSPQQLRTLLFDFMGVVSYELTDNGEKIIRDRTARLTKRAVKRNEEPPTVEEVIKQAFHEKKQYNLFAITADVLQGLKGKKEYDGIPELILAYRESKTALSTFIEPLAGRLDANDCVHGSFNPDGTATGRLCVAGNTRIDTNFGKLCISDLPRVLPSHDVYVKSHLGRMRRVLRVYLKGREDMRRLRFSDGSEVVCTKGHRIWTPQGWRAAGALSLGQTAYSGLDDFDRPAVREVRNSVGTGGATGSCVRSEDCGNRAGEPLRKRGTKSQPQEKALEQSRLGCQCEILVQGRGTGTEGDCCTESPLRDAENRESPRLAGDACSGVATREAGGSSSHGDTSRDDRKDYGHLGLVRHREYPSVWVADARPNSGAVAGTGRRDVSTAGPVRTGNFESRSCRELQSQSDGIFQPAVCGASSRSTVSLDNSASCECAQSSPDEVFGVRPARDLLEPASQRAVVGFGASRKENSTLSSVHLAGDDSACGLLYPRRETVDRGRWGAAQTPSIASPGSAGGRLGQSEGVPFNAIQRHRGLEGFTRCAGSHWRVVQLVEIQEEPEQLVWDIEVEGDHSYVAQGLIHHNSSANPNLQNLPSKDKGTVKSCYISRFTRRKGGKVIRRGYILQADYSQIELRVAASFFDEPKMIEAYVNHADLHVLTALDVFNLTQEEWDKLDPKEQKLKRTMTKRVNFGILYQGGPDALVKTLKKDGVFITREEAERLIEAYFEKRPDLKENIEAFKAKVAEDGFYTAFTGYTRRVPDVFSVNRSLVNRALRQIVNFPIQHIAGWMTLISLCIIERRLKAAKMKSMLVLTVHDSIILDCPEEEVFKVAAIVKDVMENIAEYSKEILPELDWSWLTVPIVAELEVGESWGYAVPFDPKAKTGKGPLWEDKEDKGKVQTKYLRPPINIEELRKSTRHATKMAA